MTTPMHPDTGARALDALPPNEAAAFDEHITDCEPCAVEYAEFLATTAMLTAAVAEPPPESLREKVLQAAARIPQLPPLVRPADQDIAQADENAGAEVGASSPRAARRNRQRAVWWRRPFPLIAAAAAAALIAAVVVVATLPSNVTANEAAARCVSAAPDAQVRHPSVGSGGSVSVARSCDAAVIQLASLPNLAPGKAYQLWLLVGDKARSAGMVAAEASPEGRIVVMHLGATDTGLAVSVEPAGGSKQPTSTPIWVVPLGA